jgi:transposase
MLVRAVRVVRCVPKTHPCPGCGKRGRRKRLLRRRIRSLAYRQVAYLDVHYAEYRCRCRCRKSFRSWPLDVPPKAEYCPLVRQAVLDRLLGDGLNVERTRAAMKRDFLLDLSVGFIHDCLDGELARIDLPGHRQRTLERFSGTLCVDELHLGRHVLLLATDPLADEVVGFALVGANDQAHLRRFLLMLKGHGFLPEVVISDGSNLYPAVLAEVWPRAKHQLCVFHVLQDVTEKVLDAVRRLRQACERRGKAGRKRKRGRPRKGARRRARGKGPTNKEKAAFVFKRRYLIVKRAENLGEQERADLERMFGYLPELKVLWEFSQEIYKVWDTEQGRKTARWRWTRLKNNPEYQAVPELEEALAGLEKGKVEKTLAFLGQPLGERQKTNNHVERMNRKLRFDEKARYKWRRRKSIVRWVLLRISRHVPRPKAQGQQPPAARDRGG